MIYRIIAAFSATADIVREAMTLRRKLGRRYGWMPE